MSSKTITTTERQVDYPASIGPVCAKRDNLNICSAHYPLSSNIRQKPHEGKPAPAGGLFGRAAWMARGEGLEPSVSRQGPRRYRTAMQRFRQVQMLGSARPQMHLLRNRIFKGHAFRIIFGKPPLKPPLQWRRLSDNPCRQPACWYRRKSKQS